jgi:hypothetical protein
MKSKNKNRESMFQQILRGKERLSFKKVSFLQFQLDMKKKGFRSFIKKTKTQKIKISNIQTYMKRNKTFQYHIPISSMIFDFHYVDFTSLQILSFYQIKQTIHFIRVHSLNPCPYHQTFCFKATKVKSWP